MLLLQCVSYFNATSISFSLHILSADKNKQPFEFYGEGLAIIDIVCMYYFLAWYPSSLAMLSYIMDLNDDGCWSIVPGWPHL